MYSFIYIYACVLAYFGIYIHINIYTGWVLGQQASSSLVAAAYGNIRINDFEPLAHSHESHIEWSVSLSRTHTPFPLFSCLLCFTHTHAPFLFSSFPFLFLSRPLFRSLSLNLSRSLSRSPSVYLSLSLSLSFFLSLSLPPPLSPPFSSSLSSTPSVIYSMQFLHEYTVVLHQSHTCAMNPLRVP